MSAEEDTELRDLVAQTLEANGVLGRIRVNLMSILVLVKMVASGIRSLRISLDMVPVCFC